MKKLFRRVAWVASPREPVSSLSHLFAAALAVYGTVLLLSHAGNREVHLAASLIYGLSLIFLFLASSVLHGVKCSERSATLLEKLDHIGIYLVIAGTYTPICLLLIKGSLGVWILSLQWSVALIGIAMTLSRALCSKRTTAILFLLMGWSVLLILPTLLRLLSAESAVWFFVGAGLYSVGALVFVYDWPHPKPGYVSAHDLWHLMVVMATSCHYMLIFNVMA